MLSQLGHVMVGVVDSLMVGKLGEIPLAASSLANSVFFFFLCFGVGVSYGLTPLVSQYDHPNENQKTTSLLKNSLVINLILATIICLVVVSMNRFLNALGQDEEVVLYAKPYLWIITMSIIPFMIFQTLRQFSEGLSFTKQAMYVIVGSNLINVVFNYFLIFGKFGFPQLGLDGAGYATLLSRVIMAFWMVWLVMYNKKIKNYVDNFWSIKLSTETIKKLLNIGIPSGFQFSFEVCAFVAAAIMMGWLGSTPQAAHQIAINLATISYMMASGLSTAATIRVGNQLGRKDYKTLQEAIYSIIVLVIVIQVFWMTVFILGRDFLPTLYINDNDVIVIASRLLILAAIFQISDGLQVVLLGALRGLSDTKIPTYFTLISYWVIGLPVGYYLGFTLGFNGVGVWIGLIIGLAVTAFLLVLRFRRLSNNLVEANK